MSGLAEEQLRRLYDITSSPVLHLKEKVDLLLRLGCEQFQLEVGVLSHINDGTYEILQILAPDDAFKAGDTLPLENTYCEATLKLKQPLSFEYAGQTEWRFHPCYKAYHLESYIGTPIIVNEQTYGTLCFFGSAPRSEPFSSADKEFLRLMAQWVAGALERKRTKDALQKEQDFVKAVIDNAAGLVIVLDTEGRIVRLNPAIERLTGYSFVEVKGQNFWDVFVPPGESERRKKRFKELKPENFPFEQESQWLAKDGSQPYIAWVCSAIYDEKGDIEYIIGTGIDTTERRRVEQLKQEFISIVSHELRTPLTSIRGALGLVVGGVAGEIPTQAKAMIEIASKNSERLVNLINDILDIEKIEAGKMNFEFKPVNLLTIIEQAMAANQAYAQQYKVEFELVTDSDEVMAEIDPDRIIQVLNNLLSNAAKFSPSGGKVVISVTTKEDKVRVAVKDSGSGIPESFKNRIFQKFAQANSSDTRQKGGTGLGLSIAKAIVEKHRGQIDFESTAGQGTTFYFDLPIWKNPQPIVPSQVSVEPTTTALICENDQAVAKTLTAMLNQTGFKADIAYSANQARNFLTENDYSVLLLDLMLPDEDGVDLIRELRENKKTRNLPIIIVSATADTLQEKLDGNLLAVVDWIDKPIDRQRLIAAVNQAARTSNTDKPRILYVEDDSDTVMVISTVLADVATISSAKSINAAKQKLFSEQFDLMMLDISLPDGYGLDLLPILQNLEYGPVPVVIFSAQEISPQIAKKVAATLVKTRTKNAELIKTIDLVLKRASLNLATAIP